MSINPVHNISDKDRILLLTLSRIKGIGIQTLKKLMQTFHSPDGIFSAKLKSLERVISYSAAQRIVSKKCIKEIGLYIEELNKARIQYVTIYDKDYPQLLREISDPPIILYYKGSIAVSDLSRCFAVVGTRKSTRYGKEVTERLVQGLSDKGFTIISGMAFGIDAIAHQAALDAGQQTVAVLSSRVDVAAPRSNYRIYQEILSRGLVISEAHLDWEVNPGMFPARNRIISGLSIGTLVVEAGRKSGALITARLALEQGREVFAVAGDILKKQSEGVNALIKRGEAKLVQSVDDIIEEFGFINNNRSQAIESVIQNYSGDEKKVIDFLIRGPARIDEISRGIQMPISKLSQLITTMELEEKLAKVDGDLYGVVQ